MKKIHYSKIIGISGKIGTGKTVLSEKLHLYMKSDLISTGNFIRNQALYHAIEPKRENLQNLGLQLINKYGYEKFVIEFLRSELKFNNDVLIIEGIRHLKIWEELIKYSNKSLLIFSDISEKNIIPNVKERDNLNEKDIKKSFSHLVENEDKFLKKNANLILYNYIDDDFILKIVEKIKNL